MIIKMLLTVDYDPESNTYTPIKQEIVTDKVTKSKAKVEKEESPDPIIKLESNKYVLNQAAVNLLGVKWEDRILIKYQKVEGVTFPIIGTDKAFNELGGGNKLTKSLTVSCRGKANELLVKYGTTFSVTNMKEFKDLFVLVGDAEVQPEEPVDNIEIKEDDADNVDLVLDTTLEEAKEITSEDFEL